MSTDPFLAEISMFPYTFAPRNYTWCQGQLIAISQFQSLYAVMGTIYGGDARVTMGLPNLKGRTPVQHGTGPGLTSRLIGSTDGSSGSNP